MSPPQGPPPQGADRSSATVQPKLDGTKLTHGHNQEEQPRGRAGAEPRAVVHDGLSTEDLEALEETLDVLSDPDALRDIATALADVEEGRYVGEEELRTRFRTA